MAKKYRLYIDETGNPDLNSSSNPNHRFLSLTGVAMELDYVANVVNPQLESMKKELFGQHPDEPIILHRKDIVNYRYPFEKLRDEKERMLFNDKLLKYFSQWQYSIFSVVIDKLEHKRKYIKWRYDTYHYCLMILMERFTKYLEENQAVGDVMAESRGGKEDIRLKKSFSRLFEEGSDFVSSDLFLKYFTSKQLKVKPKQNNVSGLQIADLLAHPSRREILIENELIQDDRKIFSDSICKIINTKYYSKEGKVYGYGKKLLP